MAKFDFNEIAANAKREAENYVVGRVLYRAIAELKSDASAYQDFDTVTEAETYLRSMWKLYLNEGKDYRIADMRIKVIHDLNSLDNRDLKNILRDLKNEIVQAMMIEYDFFNVMKGNRGIIDYLKAKRIDYLYYAAELAKRGRAYVYVISRTTSDGFEIEASILPLRRPDGSYSILDTFMVTDDTWNEQTYDDGYGESWNFLELCEKAYEESDSQLHFGEERDIWENIIEFMTKD